MKDLDMNRNRLKNTAAPAKVEIAAQTTENATVLKQRSYSLDGYTVDKIKALARKYGEERGTIVSASEALRIHFLNVNVSK